MKQKIKIKTGQTVDESGIYGVSGTRDEVVLSKGDRVPPYDGEAKKFTLHAKPKHKKN